MEDKLKRVMAAPASTGIMTSTWLRSAGISSQLVSKYVRSGWLTSIGHGAYTRDPSNLTWQHGLSALQSQLNIPVWLGGLSSLSLHGFGHQLRMGKDRVWLHTQVAAHMPKWFSQYPWSVDFVLANRRLFTEDPTARLVKRDSDGVTLNASRPEMAVLEYLNSVRDRSSFDDAADVLTGALTLSPIVMQELLETCRSIRVKRMTLYFADNLSLPWFKKLQLNRIDLGAGPRQIVADGQLDSRYQITVPKSGNDGF